MSHFFSGLFHYRFGVTAAAGGGGGSGAPGFIDDGDAITVANYAALPDAATNNGKLAWVISTTGSLWTKKYSGWYISDGAAWTPADLPDDQYVVTAALQTDVDAADTLLLQAYDVDGAAYTTFGTLTANNTPTFDLSTAVTIGGNAFYYVTGTDVAVTDGGTGASTATGAATNLGLGTGDSPQFTAVNVGHATDTTVARSAAGRLSVESINLARVMDVIRLVGFTASGTPTTGKQKGYAVCPVAGTITGWGFQVNAGTATVKTWKVATGTAVPTVANVINTSGVAISANTAVRSTTVTDFTSTAVAAGDFFAFDLTAVSGVTEMSFWLEITPT
jgi:hypothetical protein